MIPIETVVIVLAVSWISCIIFTYILKFSKASFKENHDHGDQYSETNKYNSQVFHKAIYGLWYFLLNNNKQASGVTDILLVENVTEHYLILKNETLPI